MLHSGNVGEVLDSKDERGQNAQLLKDLDLEQVLDRNVENLSGGLAARSADGESLLCSLRCPVMPLCLFRCDGKLVV